MQANPHAAVALRTPVREHLDLGLLIKVGYRDELVAERATRRRRLVPRGESFEEDYQQKPSNRILLLPFINGSQAQKIRLLDILAQFKIQQTDCPKNKTYTKVRQTLTKISEEK